METEEGIIEIIIRCLEFEDVSSATSNQEKTLKLVLSSVKSAKETLETRNPPSLGQIVDVSEKHDHFGIDYRAFLCLSDPKRHKKLFPVKFNSVGFQRETL